MAAKSYNRDLGVAVKGAWETREGRGFPWFIMAANGLGANRYIGGAQNEEFLFTNSTGELYYGARIDAKPHQLVTAGVHASHNVHNDVAMGDRGPVFDIERKVWTTDVQLGRPGAGGLMPSTVVVIWTTSSIHNSTCSTTRVLVHIRYIRC